MKSILFVLGLLSGCYGQLVGVGGANPPTTFPNVNGFNALNGKYKHVVILSVDGLHQVYNHPSRQ